ncbi:MAG: propanediol/glycerol family dehydratase large subunit [Veillonella sp.]
MTWQCILPFSRRRSCNGCSGSNYKFVQILGFSITDQEVEAATYANGSKDMPPRDKVADIKAAQDLLNRGVTGVDFVKGLAKEGHQDVAQSILNLLKQKISGDYLQTSAIFDRDFNVISAINNRNDYQGVGTGYRVEGEDWERIKDIPNAIDPRDI